MGTSPSPYLTAPGRLGRYPVHRKLGSGSLGTVYLVRDPRRRRLVALKVLRTDRLSAEAVGRLQKEFRAIASLHHEQIATAHDFGYTESGSVPYYTREYVQGTPLPPGPPGSCPPQEFLRPILDLLDALEYLHAHGILHLDIHPGNLIVADDKMRGSVLIDFGVIPSAGGTGLQTGWEPWSGMPPEMLGRGAPSRATDIFLAGRVLHYRLTGDARGEVRLPREIPGWGPRRTLEIERIAGKALQPDPRQRFASAREFREALARAIGEPGRELHPSEPRGITVGRDAEIQAIEDALRDVLSGKSRVLRFMGPAGSGKTHLLGEARVRAQLRGLEVVEASFFPGSAPGFLRAAFEATRAACRGKARWLEHLSAKHGGSPEERARRAAKAFFDEPVGPLVLIADDLHLADGESRLLAEALLAEISSLGPDPSRRSLGIFVAPVGPPGRGARRQDVRFLKPLSPAEARALLQALVRPLVIPGPLLKKASAEGRGSPLRLREIARALALEWSRSGVIPPGASLPSLQEGPAGGVTWAGIEAQDRELLYALAMIGRPASREEIAAALQRNVVETRRSLRRARAAGLVAPLRHGRGRRYRLSRLPSTEEVASSCPGLDSRMVHARLARFLGAVRKPDLDLEADLARHLLLSGERHRGIDLALSAAARLRKRGQAGRAVRLLEEASSSELPVRTRLRVAEEISSILEETGDHVAGIAVMEPFHRDGLGSLSRAEAVRVRRRLGVHYHRSGETGKALAILEETQAAADAALDLEDLVFVDSELAEIHTLRGEHALAEEACRRGLARLEKIEPAGDFRARMEVTLRASLGHLDLRRMDLKSAQAELQAAARLSRRLGLRSGQPAIFNNLGIVENQLNDFTEAERAFRTAEKLLLAAGEGSGVVSISCNLAVLAAKKGDREEASLRLEQAARLLRRYPGRRLEFFVGYARGVVAHLFGDPAGAADALQEALPLARKAGDVHLARFGEVYLADAHLASGRYLQGLKLLRSTARHAEKHGPDLLRRAAHGRLFFLEAILGRSRAASRSRRLLGEIPRTGVVLVEAWNDLWMGLANVVSGESGSELFKAAREVFERLKVPCGERLASLGILLERVAKGDREALRGVLSSARAAVGEHHRLISVAEPLLRAEALWLLGDTERAKDQLSEASGAIVGASFPELDWRIELLRGLIALRAGDLNAARGHFHRSIHTRGLLVELLPARLRERFLAHPRFQELSRAATRLEGSPRLSLSTARLSMSGSFEGMVGQSSPMVRVFQSIDRLREQELPVLICGETGSGKELVAKALHRTSPRGRGPFLALHCASLPEELLESELFGYQAGAFTGAGESRPGLLESLSGGTLLLDEVTELSRASQGKLLRVLDSRKIRRLGSASERSVDVRFLASTGASMEELVKAGAFRLDLYFRLGSVRIELPPLRARGSDLGLLARHFLDAHARRLDRPPLSLSADALRCLEQHDWPGNVRELEGVLLRAAVAATGNAPLGAGDLEPFLLVSKRAPLFREEALEGRSLDELRRELEREYLTRLYRRVRGDLRKMMEILGVKQSYLYSWLRKVGIDIRSLRER